MTHSRRAAASARSLGLALLLILTFWASRAASLDALPLHNDEGLHLTRAVEVWNLHPFWEINDGKIVNHWLIAAFYPQHDAAFAGRIATVLVGVLGLAAGLALGRRMAGLAGAALAGVFWITSAYLFFYERLAFSDAEAGALVVLAVWAAWRAVTTMRWRDTLLAGVCLAAAVLFKFTAAPFALAVVLILLLLGRGSLRQRLLRLGLIGLVVALCFAPPVAYLALRGTGLFDIALGWLGGGGGAATGPVANLTRFITLTTTFGAALPAVLALCGLLMLAVFGRRAGIVLLAGALVPLALMIVLGREVLPRHFVVALPLLLTLAGIGWALLLRRLQLISRRVLGAAVILALSLHFAAFAWAAWTAPDDMALPAAVRAEHLTDHSAGTGLREAVRDLPARVIPPDAPIIGSMFPDGCRRANFDGSAAFTLECGDAPGTQRIADALAANGVVYVLTDNAPRIGADMPALAADTGAQLTRVAAYPRPGETEEDASVVLWRMVR